MGVAVATVRVAVLPSATVEAVAVAPLALLAVKPMLATSLSTMVRVWPLLAAGMLQPAGAVLWKAMPSMTVSGASLMLSSVMGRAMLAAKLGAVPVIWAGRMVTLSVWV